MPLPPHDFRDRGLYQVSTDRQWRCSGRYRGQSMISDAYRPGFVSDAAGDVITFPTPYDAEQWLERQWAKAHGIALSGPA